MCKTNNKETINHAIKTALENTETVWIASKEDDSGREYAIDDVSLIKSPVIKKHVYKKWYEPDTCLCILY